MSAKHEYRAAIDGVIRNKLDEMQCQPILFVGAGLSRRYSGLPDWLGLLKLIAEEIGLSADRFAYMSQKYRQDAVSIGSALTDEVFEWAWGPGRNRFPPGLFERGVDRATFIKVLAAEIVSNNTSDPLKNKSEILAAEVALLGGVKPHAIITTNYDSCISRIFPDYEVVIGQKIIKSNLDYFGEIFKIHGCASDPPSMVLNADDYLDYNKKRKYLSAKLLTYLSEHPVFIFGYSVNDPNVVEILDDLGEVLGGEGQLIDNLFYVSWAPEIDYEAPPASEMVIAGSAGNCRIRSITTDEFGWIFQSLSQERELAGMNTKLLRALLSRTYSLIRTDIPRKKFEVDYKTLEHAISDQDKLPSILGISKAENTNMTHPYVLTQVAHKLGLSNWQAANKLLDKIRLSTGVDLKKTDNIYHCKVKTGASHSSAARKWSDAAVDLLRKVQAGDKFDLKLS